MQKSYSFYVQVVCTKHLYKVADLLACLMAMRQQLGAQLLFSNFLYILFPASSTEGRAYINVDQPTG